MSNPKISVIIPIYNAEKFIRQCLISVLASKFTDYEVLAVDDCSTDNSVAEIEKLLPHFNGRLKILSTETNSGGAGIPRNIGIKNSSGKYVTFIDNDDMILPTALGDFFDVAEKFRADVVYSEKFFVFNDTDNGNFNGKNMSVIFRCPLEKPIEEPTPATNNLRERIQLATVNDFFVIPWGRLYRRNFLLANKLEFPQMVKFGEDGIFGLKCFCLAEKYIYIPQITNIHRLRENSGARLTVDSHEGVRMWLDVIIKNIASLDEFLDTFEDFRQDLRFRQEVLSAFIDKHFTVMESFFANVPKFKVQKVFCDELQNPELNPIGKNLVAAYLYAERVLKK